MISYLFSTLALPEIVPKYDATNLFHLIGLGLRTVALKIYLIVDACLAEQVVTATDPFGKAESQHQRSDVFETDICVASATQHLLERFLVLAHRAESSTKNGTSSLVIAALVVITTLSTTA
jgi:hypothetical protein